MQLVSQFGVHVAALRYMGVPLELGMSQQFTLANSTKAWTALASRAVAGCLALRDAAVT